jgi:hypothetical protein
MTEKEYFEKQVTILYDSREQEENGAFEILSYFAHNEIKTRRCLSPDNFKQGDYSFEIDGKDYRPQFLIERKNDLGEVYSNISGRKDGNTCERDRLESVLKRMKGVEERILLIGGLDNLCEAKKYICKWAGSKGLTAGQRIYSTIMSWQCANRYNFKVICRKKPYQVAEEILNLSYYYWRNEMKKSYGDNFLKKLREVKNG